MSVGSLRHWALATWRLILARLSYDLFNTLLSWCPICTPLSDTSALQQGGRIYSLQQKELNKAEECEGRREVGRYKLEENHSELRSSVSFAIELPSAENTSVAESR